MKGIFSVIVENKSGVLSKIAGLFSRRGFNIDSLTVGPLDEPQTSGMTIVSDGDERILEQIDKQLNKKIDVIKVRRLQESQCICRELLLVKVAYLKSNRREIMEICSIVNAKIVNLSSNSMIIELCDTTETVDNFIDLIKPYGILEIGRTGMLALQKENGLNE